MSDYPPSKKKKRTKKKGDSEEAKPEKKEKKEPTESFKYGVPELAEELEIAPASVRVKLRKAGIEKAGKSYGWNTQAELREVVKQLEAKSA